MNELKLLVETIADMESGVYDFTVDGKCSGCGQCCSNYLPVGQGEVDKIRRYINKYGIKEVTRFSPCKNQVDMVCPFRSDVEGKCLVYPVRPAICEDFRCDKPRKKIAADKEKYHGKYRVVNMRYEFFGHETGYEALLQAIFGDNVKI